MLLLSSSSQHHQQPVSSSPSFWIARAMGALLVCPPEKIERWLPMAAPFPKTIQESQKRTAVNRILEDCWDNNNDSFISKSNTFHIDSITETPYNRNSGFALQSMDDDWIVNNQRYMRQQPKTKNDGETNDERQGLLEGIQSRESSSSPSRAEVGTKRQDATAGVVSSSLSTSSSNSDSLFSNYFLSLHLFFSLPSIGEPDDDEIVDTVATASDIPRNPLSAVSKTSATAMKPSTYGEITPLGSRQLFGAMGLLHDTDTTTAPAHFVDLGSGNGKLVGQAVLELPNIETAKGVELSPSRHQSAIRAKRALEQWLQLEQSPAVATTTATTREEAYSFWNAQEIKGKLQLIEGDLFDLDLSTTTHIYVASLCFPDALMKRLEEVLMERIAHQKLQLSTNGADVPPAENDDGAVKMAALQWVATLRPFPNDLGGIRPSIRFMEMSWTSPLGSAVYLYRCD